MNLAAARLLLLSAALALPACGGCPQAGDGCAAVVTLDAAFRGAPDCVVVAEVTPENGCVCDGTIQIINRCEVGMVVSESSLGPSQIVRAGDMTSLLIEDGDAGRHHVEVGWESPDSSFVLEVDYQIAHREIGGCSLAGAGQGAPAGGRAAGLLGLLGLLVGRRRRTR